jgi:antitoxin CptB
VEKINNPKKMLKNLNKIRWACRRGMLELDLLLAQYVNGMYSNLSEEDQITFIALLDTPDPTLLAWLMGKESPTHPALVEMVNKIRCHAKSRF